MAKKTVARWKNLDFIIRGNGEITLGRVGPARSAAVAADGDQMLAALVRRRGESLEDLLTRLDGALEHGRTALHICAGTPLPAPASRASASIATARELLTAGADVNVVHEIPDGREVFPDASTSRPPFSPSSVVALADRPPLTRLISARRATRRERRRYEEKA